MDEVEGVRSITSGRLVACALWLGLAYGLIEGVAFSLVRLVPWAAAPLTGSSLHILWIDPIVYGVAFGVIGSAIALVARVRPGVRWDVPLVFLLVWLSAFLLVNLPDGLIANYASAALGCGVAFQVTRWYRARRSRWFPLIVRTLPHVAALVVTLAVAIVGGSRLLEAVAMRKVRPGAEAAHPNVVLLVIDTQRADHLSSYGYQRKTTPHLDRLAREGVLFEHAQSPSSWTLPSHASLMTGRWPHEHRAGDPFRPFLDGRYPTLAETLRDAGYATGAFVANTYWVGRQMGMSRGFIRYEDHLRTLSDALITPILGRKFAWEAAPLFGWVDLPARKRANLINSHLIDWLDQVGTRPFFAFVNYMDVHTPYLAPPPYSTMFLSAPRTKATEIELGPTTDEAAARLSGRGQELIDEYDGSLAYLDQEIGALLDALERRGLAQHTLVIVTSDHGESFGEHGMMFHGNSVYIDQTHVPLIMRFPGHLAAGIRDARPVSLTRLAATIASVTGAADPGFSGPTLVAPPNDAPAKGEELVLTEVARRRKVPKAWPSARGWAKSLVSARWHFILNQAGEVELYDLMSDQGELHNVAGDADMTPLVANFRTRLQRMLDAEGPLEEARALREQPAR